MTLLDRGVLYRYDDARIQTVYDVKMSTKNSENKTIVYRIYNKKTGHWGQAGAHHFTDKINLAKTWTRQTLGAHLALYKEHRAGIPEDLEVVEYTLEETGRIPASKYKPGINKCMN